MAATRWTVWVEAARPGGTSERHGIGSVQRDLSSPDPADLGLHLAEAKDLLHKLQRRLVQNQVDRASARDRTCAGCGSRRALHDRCRFSTDYPFVFAPDGGARRFLRDAALDPADKEEIAHGNWDRLSSRIAIPASPKAGAPP